MKKERNKTNKKGWLKKTGRVLRVAVPFAIGIASATFAFDNLGAIIKSSSRVKAVNVAVDDSILLHNYDNDHSAKEVLNDTLNEYYGFEASSYTNALIASRTIIEAEKDAKSTNWAGVLAGLFTAGASIGLASASDELNKFEIEEEKKEAEKEMAE